MIKCLRCGQCCYLQDPETGLMTSTPCPYLIFLKNGKTKCRIYRNRIGTITRSTKKGVNRCGFRKNSKFDFPDCPYNTDKPIATINCKSS